MNPLRRMFLRRAVGAAAFAPLAGSAVGEELRAGAMRLQAQAPLLINPPQESGPLSWRVQRARSAYDLASSASRDNLMFRVGPFDPDIAALGSVSNSAKARMQRQRDDRRRSLLERLRLRAWGS